MAEIRRFKFNGEESLALPAERAAFATLQEWLTQIAGELELPAKTGKQLLIVADEIFTNIADYGYPAAPGNAKVAVEFDMPHQCLKLTFTDSGIAYNPLETVPPELDAPLEERQIGGLGILMVKKIMDTVAYRRENGCNILEMTKNISQFQK